MKKQINMSEEEPEQRKFLLPSEVEHKFQVVDLFPDKNDPDIIAVKLEVAEGDELGRSILHRINLNPEWKGFFLTRLFLKAVGEPYKGAFLADSDNWVGREFKATIIHNVVDKKDAGGNVISKKTYANIDEFIFDVTPEVGVNPDGVKKADDIAWEQ